MHRLLWLATLTVSLAGCAFTVNDVDVRYRYNDRSGADAQGAQVNVGSFTDTRGVSNDRLIMNKRNLNGHTTSGGFQAEKPLADIVRDGVAQALKAVKAQVRPDAALELSGQLEDFSSEIVMGLWEGEFKGKLIVRFHLKDKATGATIWKDTLVGTGAVKGGEGPEGLFRATLNGLLYDLLSDESFLKAVTGRGA